MTQHPSYRYQSEPVATVCGVGTVYTVHADRNGTFSLSVQSGGSGLVELKCGMSFRTAMTDCTEMVCEEMKIEAAAIKRERLLDH
jgi:hypothetical protein